MFPKYAETSVGGIPKRAVNNPRAMESLASADLAIKAPAPFNGSYVPPVGVDPNKPPYNNPTLSGQTFVSKTEARYAVNRLRGRIARNEAAMKQIKDSGGDPSRSAPALDNNAATQELAKVQNQIKESGRISQGGLGAARPAILVPNSVLGSGNQALKPYGTRTQGTLNVSSYGRTGSITTG